MSEAPFAAYHPVLLINPSADCAALLPRLHAHGWAVEQASLAEAAQYAVDVALVRLDADSAAALPEILRVLRRSGWCWVAALDERQPFDAYQGAFFAAGCVAQVLLPEGLDGLHEALREARACTRLQRRLAECQVAQLIGNSSQARTLRRQLEQHATQSAPVLIRGETGSGKSLLARLLHGRSAHANDPLVELDCRALAVEQLHVRLFDESVGALRQPGTSVVLEGADAMPALLQEKLLDYLRSAPAVRVLTLEQGELAAAVAAGRFLEPLYGELGRLQIEVPPLRSRRGDILLLAEHFAKRYGAGSNRFEGLFADDAIEAMLEHLWPGNLDELRNRVLHALVSAQGRQMAAEDLQLAAPSLLDDSGNTLADYVLRAERQALNDALTRYSSNMSQAARALGVSRPTFYRLLHKHRMR